MKTSALTIIGRFLISLLLLLLFVGCTSIQRDVANVLPPGDYKVVSATITGKFSATQFTGENVTITQDGKMVGGHVHFRHSNIYVPLIEVDVQAKDKSP
jgi:hypothetical protein